MMSQIDLAPARAAREGAPLFTCPSVWGVSPERPILFRIPLLGERPMRVTARHLPEGVQLDKERGILTGSAAQGEYAVRLRAENRLGAAEKTLVLRVEPDGALRTPLLGFTSWNAYANTVTQDKILESARIMDESGLADFGYQYVNIDSCWQGRYWGGKIDAIQPNEKFPDMKGLIDAIHALGLKVGIYSTPMQKAWGDENLPGCTRGRLDPAYAQTYFGVGEEHMEAQNAQQWAEWGVDYLKYDWSPCDVKNAELMKKALISQNRDIPLCVTVRAGKEHADWWKNNCCSWRDNGDSNSEWPNVLTRFESDDWAAHIMPGHYFDQDMLETGVTVWHENRLTEDEQLIAYSIRAMFPSPIQISCDLTRLTEFDRALLMNEEVIAVNQDELSVGAVCIEEKTTRKADRSVERRLKVYARPLENGDMAICAFNLGEVAETVAQPAKRARDLWAKKDLSIENGCVTVELPPHTVRMLRVAR